MMPWDLYCALGWAYAIGKGKANQYMESYPVLPPVEGLYLSQKHFDEIGLLDENHFAYLEDVDLGYRAQIYGYRNVFVPKRDYAGSASSGSRYNKFKVVNIKTAFI